MKTLKPKWFEYDIPYAYYIWENYKEAMNRRREGQYLEPERFINHIHLHAKYVNLNDSFIFGTMLGGVFIPSHFAPRTIREGYRLVLQLKEYWNVVFIVTPDLTAMLKKAGYKILPFKVHQNFRGQKTEKYIAFTSLKGLFKVLAAYLKKESGYITNDEMPYRWQENVWDDAVEYIESLQEDSDDDCWEESYEDDYQY